MRATKCIVGVGTVAKRRFWAAGLTSVTVALIIIGCSGGGLSPGAVVQRFFTLLFDGKFEQAREYVAPESWDYASVGFLVSLMPLMSITGVRLINVTIERVEVRGTEATVRYRLRFSGIPDEYTSVARLRNHEGRWKIVETG